MSRGKKFLVAFIFLIVLVLINYGTDWLIPIMNKSAFFHGLMVAVGILSLPMFAVVMRFENDPRPFSPNSRIARIARVLMALEFFPLGFGLVFWGLGFWFPGLRILGYGLVGLFAVSALLLVILVLRADRANQKAKKSAGSPGG